MVSHKETTNTKETKRTIKISLPRRLFVINKNLIMHFEIKYQRAERFC